MTLLRTHLRVVFALVLREARVRYGRSRLGYTWAILEPAAMIMFLTYIFANFRGATSITGNFAVFFASGVLPFQMYRQGTNFISNGFRANKSLFNYPLVKPMDAIFARLILEAATYVVIFTIVFSYMMLVLDAPWPTSVPRMLLAMGLMLWFAFGTGVTLGILKGLWPAVGNVHQILMAPAFFISGIFFSVSTLPTAYREILLWNPLLHVIEGFRAGYFPGYRTPDVDLWYPFWWALIATFLGLLGERTVKRRNR